MSKSSIATLLSLVVLFMIILAGFAESDQKEILFLRIAIALSIAETLLIKWSK